MHKTRRERMRKGRAFDPCKRGARRDPTGHLYETWVQNWVAKRLRAADKKKPA